MGYHTSTRHVHPSQSPFQFISGLFVHWITPLENVHPGIPSVNMPILVPHGVSAFTETEWNQKIAPNKTMFINSCFNDKLHDDQVLLIGMSETILHGIFTCGRGTCVGILSSPTYSGTPRVTVPVTASCLSCADNPRYLHIAELPFRNKGG